MSAHYWQRGLETWPRGAALLDEPLRAWAGCSHTGPRSFPTVRSIPVTPATVRSIPSHAGRRAATTLVRGCARP